MGAKDASADLTSSLQALTPQLEQRWGLRPYGIFGSVARGDASASSDVDILFELDDQAQLGWDIVNAQEFVEQALQRSVDMVILPVRPQFWDSIKDDILYV